VDVPLLAALADKLPLLAEDYGKPMLRFDLVLNMPSSNKAAVLASLGGGGGGPAWGAGGGETFHQVVVELYVAPLKASDVVLGTEAVEEACREADILKGLSSDHIARMARALEEYSRVPPRHSVPRRADCVVAVRRPGRGAGAGAEGAGGLGKGYELEVVAVESPECVGVNVKIERRVHQLVNELTKKDASIRLPLQEARMQWEKAARDLVLSNICQQLASILKVKPDCFEPVGLHVHGEHTLVDLNIHHQPSTLQHDNPFQTKEEHARARRQAHIATDIAKDREGGDGLSALQIYDMVQQQIADPASALQRTFLSSTTRVILRGQPHAVWKTKPFKAQLPRSQENIGHVIPAAQRQQQASEKLSQGGWEEEAAQEHPAGGDSSLASIPEKPGASSPEASSMQGKTKEKEVIASTAAAAAAAAAARLEVSLDGDDEGEGAQPQQQMDQLHPPSSPPTGQHPPAPPQQQQPIKEQQQEQQDANVDQNTLQLQLQLQLQQLQAQVHQLAQQQQRPTTTLPDTPRETEVLTGVKFYHEGKRKGNEGMKEKLGPVPYAKLKELVDTGVINIHTRVWRNRPPGGEVWL
jgi:hypothetical protein